MSSGASTPSRSGDSGLTGANRPATTIDAMQRANKSHATARWPRVRLMRASIERSVEHRLLQRVACPVIANAGHQEIAIEPLLPTLNRPDGKLAPLSLRDRALAIEQADIEPPGALDRLLHGNLARMTQGVSLAGLGLAWMDWGMHLAQSPGKWLSTSRQGAAQRPALAGLCGARVGGRCDRTVHRSATAGPALCQPGMAALAI